VNTSIFLARLIGPPLAVLGVGMLLHPAVYVAAVVDMLRSPGLIYLACFVGLLGGVALVLVHNVWERDWRVIITLLGWISIVDSASWILLPRLVQQFWSPMLATGAFPILGGGLTLLLGAVLCYYGYRAAHTGRTT
jgi:hypothetical protein